MLSSVPEFYKYACVMMYNGAGLHRNIVVVSMKVNLHSATHHLLPHTTRVQSSLCSNSSKFWQGAG